MSASAPRCLTSVAYELIVVLNAASERVEDALRSHVEGARFVKSAVNLGFAGGCNLGASVARGEYLVLLNDDAIVEPGWLDWLVQSADANPNAGAVGSCILFPDGRVQEAGSVIWNDGSTMPVGRNADGESLTWHFVRAGRLCVRMLAPHQPHDVGCARRNGSRVSSCVLRRRRSVPRNPRLGAAGSLRAALARAPSRIGQLRDTFKSFLFRRNQKRLVEKWAHELAFREPPASLSSIELSRAVWRARGCPQRILIIDDRVPDAALGSGYGRMVEAALDLSASGYAVSIFPVIGVTMPFGSARQRRRRPWSTRISRDHLRRPEISYDAVIISRPHNYNRFYDTVRKLQPRAAVVYDCEALFWRRLVRQAELAATPEEAAALQAQAAGCGSSKRRLPYAPTSSSRCRARRPIFFRRSKDHCPIYDILPAERLVNFTSRSFAERRDMGFVAGWLAGPTSPNADGLRWFVGEVLPRVTAGLAVGARSRHRRKRSAGDSRARQPERDLRRAAGGYRGVLRRPARGASRRCASAPA